MKDGQQGKSIWRSLFGKERRKAERQTVPGLVAYYWDGGPPISHPIREISLTGMFLLTDQRWYPGTVMMMRLQQEDGADSDPDRSITVYAKIVRWGTDGVGMAFLAQGQSLSQNGHDRTSSTANQKSLKKFVRPV
ncbi:MAG: PilZ domain-containing protein [Acidobacteriaceae bacterium]